MKSHEAVRLTTGCFLMMGPLASTTAAGGQERIENPEKPARADPDKGILFDVFDTQRKFQDSFFIPTKSDAVRVQGDSLRVGTG